MRKPILTDGAHWYSEACRWLRLNHQVYGTKLKNLMQRSIHQHIIKDRTDEYFDDHSSCRKENCYRQQCMELVKIIRIDSTYENKQNAVYDILDNGRLS